MACAEFGNHFPSYVTHTPQTPFLFKLTWQNYHDTLKGSVRGGKNEVN